MAHTFPFHSPRDFHGNSRESVTPDSLATKRSPVLPWTVAVRTRPVSAAAASCQIPFPSSRSLSCLQQQQQQQQHGVIRYRDNFSDGHVDKLKAANVTDYSYTEAICYSP